MNPFAPPAPQSIPGPDDVTRVVLPNGIVVLARANFNSPSISLQGSLSAGSLYDSDEKLGLADFTAGALMRGTAQRGFQQIYDALESAGASLGFSGNTHTAGFGGKSLAEDLDLLLDILADSLLHPAFPNDQIERLRAQILTDLALRADDTGDMASLAFDELVYRQHPYARPEDGHPETVKAIARKDLADFHKRHYGPRGMIVVVVGGIEPQRAVEKIQAALGDWQNPKQPPEPALPDWTPLPERINKRVDMPGKFQSDLIIGTAGPRRSDPDYMPAAVGNNILGQFGLMGRIGDSVRERAGLAYYAGSSLGAGIGPAAWSVSAGVNPKNEAKAAELIFEELRRFTTELVTEEELSDSQANYIGRLPLSLESNSGVAGALLYVERHNLGLDYYRRYPDLIRAVTREQILESAVKHLNPDRLALAAAGPPLA